MVVVIHMLLLLLLMSLLLLLVFFTWEDLANFARATGGGTKNNP